MAHAHAHLACSPHSLAESLREAEALCEARGGRLTPLRKQVLTLLLESEGPAKAYDLLSLMGSDGEAAKPPSVYRSLDFLLEMGLAHRIESLNAFVACGHWKHGHAAVFLICDKCGTAGELHAGDSVKKLTQEVESVKFKMRNAVIEIRGLCRDCAALGRGGLVMVLLKLSVVAPPKGVPHALQGKDGEIVDARMSTGRTLVFEIPVRLEEGKAGWRWLGDFVRTEGKSRRFVYVGIGKHAGHPHTHWDRRAKVDLPDVTTAMIAKAKAGKLVLAGSYAGTDAKGEPSCATVKVEWVVT